MAGHQPQLFHPGVWYKNFVLEQLAAEHGGTAINLVIDSDAMRTAAIRVPTGSLSDPRIESIAYGANGRPIEHYRAVHRCKNSRLHVQTTT